jgi:hypothetical protein
MLTEYSRKHGLPVGSKFASEFERLMIKGAGGSVSHSSREKIAQPRGSFLFLTGLIDLPESTADVWRVARALEIVSSGIEQSEGEDWLIPELLRLKGELLLLQGHSGTAQKSEDFFRKALADANRLGMMSWELRAATSLARLFRDQGRGSEAVTCLQPVYDRFTEGFGTADLVAAKQLLDKLSDSSRR